MEALAAGAILVSSSLGGLPEAAGRFAHYCDPADPNSFDRALASARAERDRYLVEPDAEADRQASVRVHLQKFAGGRIAQQLLAQLRSMVATAD